MLSLISSLILNFFCCLNDNVTSLPVDNRVWIEVYDTLVAVETLVYKPYKYVYTNTITSSSPDVPNKHEQVIGDYLPCKFGWSLL